MNEKQAQILRESVWWAEREVQQVTLEPDEEVTGAGAWEQGSWATVSADDLYANGWSESMIDGELEPSSQFAVVTCQTTGCIAGHINHAVGRPLAVPSHMMQSALMRGYGITADDVLVDGERMTIAASALEVLGLGSVVIQHPDGYYCDLFSGSNTIDDVREIADLILEEQGHAPVGQVPANFIFTPPRNN